MAGEDDVTATLGLDYSAYLKGLGVARDEMGRFTKAVVDMDTRAGRAMKANAAGIGGLSSKVRTLRPALQEMTDGTIKTAGGLKEMQAQSAQLMRLSAALGPELGSLVALAGKVRGTESSGIGGATLAMGAFGVALGVVYRAGSSVVDVLGDIESHADQIEKARLGGLITADEVKNIEAASIAYENLWTPLDDLQILLTAHVSPAISNFAIGLEYVSALARGFTMDEAIQQAQDFYDKIHGLNTLESAVPDWMKTLPGNGAHLVTVDEQKAKDDAARSTAQPATARNRAAPSGGVDAIQSSMFLAGITIPKSQIDLHAAGLAAVADLDQQYADEKAARDKASADEAIAQIEREKAARQQATSDAIDMASALSSTLTTLAIGLTDAQVAATEDGTEAHSKALYDQFVAQKAAALATIAINTAVGATQDLAKGGVAGVLIGAATIAAGAIQAGLVLGTQAPKLHTGGLAPDEQYGMPRVVTRNNERSAVLTQEGQRHLNDLDRINSGAVGGGQTLHVIVRDDSGRRMSGREFGKTQPAVGFAPRAVR